MRTLLGSTLVAVLLGTLVPHAEQQSVRAESVDVCRLQADPLAYNHKLVEISGRVEHDFEGFSLVDSTCVGPVEVWLEYGGAVNSETVYCCGPTAGAARRRTLVVEGVTLPLVDDATFRRFDGYIRNGGKYNAVKFGATLRGRFFAGEKQRIPNGGEVWGGYGHLGCCSLLVIEQVLAVDAEPPPIAIRLGAVGPVAIGTSMQDITRVFPADRRRSVDLRLEGHPTPAVELTLAGSNVAGGIVAELQRRDRRDEVSRLWIKDPIARTEKGIGVGSTVAELRSAYRVAWVSWGEGRLYLRVDELGASFELDQGALGAQLAGTKDPDAVPGDVKIVGVLLTAAG